jgi:hypothetical protein
MRREPGRHPLFAELQMWVIVAAVSAALLTGLISYPLYLLAARRTAAGTERELRQKAYADLLIASLALPLRVHTLLTTLKSRSGLAEGIAVTFGTRQAMDPMALLDWINADYAALMNAWSRAWAYGTPEGIALSNVLLESCGRVMELLSIPAAKGIMEQGRRTVAGIETGPLVEEWNRRIAAIAHARRDLAAHMRAETGREPAVLFSEESAVDDLTGPGS